MLWVDELIETPGNKDVCKLPNLECSKISVTCEMNVLIYFQSGIYSLQNMAHFSSGVTIIFTFLLNCLPR